MWRIGSHNAEKVDCVAQRRSGPDRDAKFTIKQSRRKANSLRQACQISRRQAVGRKEMRQSERGNKPYAQANTAGTRGQIVVATRHQRFSDTIELNGSLP